MCAALNYCTAKKTAVEKVTLAAVIHPVFLALTAKEFFCFRVGAFDIGCRQRVCNRFQNGQEATIVFHIALIHVPSAVLCFRASPDAAFFVVAQVWVPNVTSINCWITVALHLLLLIDVML